MTVRANTFRSAFACGLPTVLLIGLCLLPAEKSCGQDRLATDARGILIQIETDAGKIVAVLDSASAPVTVRNFLAYVDSSYYDGGVIFRTVRADNQPDNDIKIDVIQGRASEDHASAFEPIQLERTRDTGLHHRNGTISMARSGPDTATSHFFICIGDQPELDFGGARNPDGQGFAAFGSVIEGMETVKSIHERPAEKQQLTPPVQILSISRLN